MEEEGRNGGNGLPTKPTGMTGFGRSPSTERARSSILAVNAHRVAVKFDRNSMQSAGTRAFRRHDDCRSRRSNNSPMRCVDDVPTKEICVLLVTVSHPGHRIAPSPQHPPAVDGSRGLVTHCRGSPARPCCVLPPPVLCIRSSWQSLPRNCLPQMLVPRLVRRIAEGMPMVGPSGGRTSGDSVGKRGLIVTAYLGIFGLDELAARRPTPGRLRRVTSGAAQGRSTSPRSEFARGTATLTGALAFIRRYCPAPGYLQPVKTLCRRRSWRGRCPQEPRPSIEVFGGVYFCQSPGCRSPGPKRRGDVAVERCLRQLAIPRKVRMHFKTAWKLRRGRGEEASSGGQRYMDGDHDKTVSG